MGFKENNYIVNYRPLHILLAKNDMKNSDLHHIIGLNWNIVSKINDNKDVSMSTLAQICLHFDCQLSDICTIKKDPGN